MLGGCGEDEDRTEEVDGNAEVKFTIIHARKKIKNLKVKFFTPLMNLDNVV